MTYNSFATVSTERIAPDDRKTAAVFSRLGYKIADAVADLVDNSVDAKATEVRIRFVRSANGVHSVMIADNGSGMDEEGLHEAMRFGSRSTKSGHQLGKYGVGLKSASLSQADTVTVLTQRDRAAFGRRWTLESVQSGWNCELLDKKDVGAAFRKWKGDLPVSPSGTVIIWERLEHLRTLPHTLDKVLERTTKELVVELGIRFHRFIEDGRLVIGIDQATAAAKPTGIKTKVLPLDPFGYDNPGKAGYPITLAVSLGSTSLAVECHVWPPKSPMPGYRLGGGKVAQRQGFYFYRNDRVIQAGGWNGIRADDGEPHLSLARVKVDLPASVDSIFKLDVTKSRLDPTPLFMSGLAKASRDEVTFEKYLAHAEAAYRKQTTKDGASFPVLPGAGLPLKARESIRNILQEKGTGRAKVVRFKWSKLDPDEIVRIDAGDGALLLNTAYRARISEGETNDAPVLKMALLLLFQKEFLKSFTTAKSSEWLQRINHALIAALKT